MSSTRQVYSNVLYRTEPVITNLCVVEGEEAEHLHLLDGVDGACPGHVQQLHPGLSRKSFIVSFVIFIATIRH